jgi:hypothetical protein
MNAGLERIWKEAIVAYLRYYPGIHLQELGNTTKNISQDRQPKGRDLKPGPPEYKARVLTTRPWRSVLTFKSVLWDWIEKFKWMERRIAKHCPRLEREPGNRSIQIGRASPSTNLRGLSCSVSRQIRQRNKSNNIYVRAINGSQKHGPFLWTLCAMMYVLRCMCYDVCCSQSATNED